MTDLNKHLREMGMKINEIEIYLKEFENFLDSTIIDEKIKDLERRVRSLELNVKEERRL